MPEILISPEELGQIASEFKKASKENQKILQDLEKAMSHLSSKWQGATQQLFYRDYVQWHEHALGFSEVLSHISSQLDAIAARFQDADR